MGKSSKFYDNILEVLADEKEYTFNDILEELEKRMGPVDRKKLTDALYRLGRVKKLIIPIKKGIYKIDNKDEDIKVEISAIEKYIEELRKIAVHTDMQINRRKLKECLEDEGKYIESKCLYDANRKLKVLIQEIENNSSISPITKV